MSNEYKVKFNREELSSIHTTIETITSEIYLYFLELLEKNQIHATIFQLLNEEEFEACFGKTKNQLKSLMVKNTEN